MRAFQRGPMISSTEGNQEKENWLPCVQRNNCLGGTAQGTLTSSFTLCVSNGPVRAGAAPLCVPSANVRVLATSVTLLV